MRAVQNLLCVVAISINILVLLAAIINAEDTTSSSVEKESSAFEKRDVEIREALVAIFTGKLPPNDDRLIQLMIENIKEAAAKASTPTAGIEAAARVAQEAVSEVTAAYTAIIFQSSTATEAEYLFARFTKTVNNIVDFAKSGHFIT